MTIIYKGDDIMPKKKVTPEVLGEMERLKGEGLTYHEIAEKTGLSPPTVAVYLGGKGKRTRITPEIIDRGSLTRR